MKNLPPFDPPYHAISEDFAKALLNHEKCFGAADESVNPISSTNETTVPGPVISTKANAFFLVVPFAEKDDAKKLGARWNAEARKWYVPLGKDVDAFKRWMPKE